MLKSIAKRLLWRLAGCEWMPARRLGWSLLRLWELLTARSKAAPSEVSDPMPTSQTLATQKQELEALYHETERGSTYSSPAPTNSDRKPAEKLKRLLVLAPSLPKFDSTSSGVRIRHAITALSEHFHEVVFYHEALSEKDPIYKRALPSNVRFYHAGTGKMTEQVLPLTAEAEAIFITDLFDPLFIRRCNALVQRITNESPHCRVILDTMDCHWKKYVRKAQLSGSDTDWVKAWDYLTLERELYPQADLLTVVTQTDADDLALSIPQCPGCAVMPNCYVLGTHLPDFRSTSGLCFVGSAGVNHNLDAMRYFRDEILPELHRKDPGIRIHVVGKGWDSYKAEFLHNYFVFRGLIDDLDHELGRYRIFVCPLTYGAGLKGKLGSAASAGIPIVTSSIGAEGYPLSTEDPECLVADDPLQFCDNCLELIENETIWFRKRNQFRNLIEDHYGFPTMKKAVREIAHHISLLRESP